MCCHAGCWLGELGGGKAVVAWESAEHWAVRFALCILLFVLCILLSVLLLLLFPLFAVLLNCPDPDPQVFAFFFPFSSLPQLGGRGDRVTSWPFVAGYGQTTTVGQAGLAPGEAMLAVSNHLPVPHVP